MTIELDTMTVDIAADTPLSGELIAAVLAVATAAEDAAAAGRQATTVLTIRGAREGAEFPWPGAVPVGLVGKWENAVRRLEQAPTPIVAIVDGDAYGPAAELLLIADYRVVSAGAVFRLAAVGGGTWPAMALHRLVAQLGVSRARELAIQGRALPATVAGERGLVDAVVEPGGESAAVGVGVALFAETVGSELAIRRRLLLDAVNTRFEDALGAHLAAADRTLRRTKPVER
ncbi:enoyl-CoA-hydratase DpgB [Nocardia sp. NPDC060249]|uniref:enoyl-CoA-hydratase DpgB n=1 Tax=Nocardia sp. NPDC060249 TaxID=3347082 RepID=UPI00365269B6